MQAAAAHQSRTRCSPYRAQVSAVGSDPTRRWPPRGAGAAACVAAGAGAPPPARSSPAPPSCIGSSEPSSLVPAGTTCTRSSLWELHCGLDVQQHLLEARRSLEHPP